MTQIVPSMYNTRKHIPRKLLAKRQSLMLHSLAFVTGDPSIKISFPYVFHPGLQVTVNEPGDSKWLYMMLPVTRGSLITDINIAHHRTGLQSHIVLIRLVEQREPVVATVVHDEVIEKTVSSNCIVGTSCQVVVKNSIMLKVCMDFGNTDDMIELGSVEVSYIPEYVSLPDHVRSEVEGIKQKKESVSALNVGNYSWNLQQPPYAKLLFQKKQKKKVSF